MSMFSGLSNGVKGLATTGISLAGGGIVSAAAGAIGAAIGGNANTDPAARNLATSFPPGVLVRLGTPLKSQQEPATAAAPVPGTFYIDSRNGLVYESKAAGFYPTSAAWAMERSTLWNQKHNKTITPAIATIGGGAIGLVIAAGLIFALMRK